MTTHATSQCAGVCKHFRSPLSRPDGDWSGGPTCAAFPDGIPDLVFRNMLDHRQPIAGDRGIRWESNGEPYPDWALPHP